MKIPSCPLGNLLSLPVLVASTVLSIARGPASHSTRAKSPSLMRPVRGTPSFVLMSDTQAPLGFEKFRLKSDNNEVATDLIFRNIGRDSTVTALFHLGDFSALGSFDSYWEEFTERAAPVWNAGIPIYPAFGNHEYMPFASRGRERLVGMFPFMDTSWYYRRIGRTAIVILNSNFSHLGVSEVVRQQSWYASVLDRLDEDTTVSITLVACHNPPFTNSTIVSPSADVLHLFVPPFMKAKKAKVFISGHAHAFEHFRASGKDFLVTGGGGGLLHPLLHGDERRQPDLYPHDSERSFFHYLRCVSDNQSLRIQVIRLLPEFSRFDTAYVLQLGFDSD